MQVSLGLSWVIALGLGAIWILRNSKPAQAKTDQPKTDQPKTAQAKAGLLLPARQGEAFLPPITMRPILHPVEPFRGAGWDVEER